MRRQYLPVLFLLLSLTLHALPSFDPVGKADVGYVFYSIERDSVVMAHNASQPYVYASNVKLVTSAAALHYLGGGHRFYTLFAYCDSTHTLFVRGGGLTTTTIEDFHVLAMDLAERGMTPVDSMVVDDWLYGDNRYNLSAGEEDLGDYAYLAYTGPLCLDYNNVRIAVRPGRLGQPPEVLLRVPGEYVRVENYACTVEGKRHRLNVTTEAEDGHTVVRVSGTIGVERHAPVVRYKRIYHPTEHYAAALLGYLGASPDTPVRRANLPDSLFSSADLRTWTLASPPLREELRAMNVWSNNMMAESLCRQLGLQELHNADAGPRVLEEFCRTQLGHEVSLVNGSGLGNGFNKLTPSLLVNLLRWAWRDPMLVGVDLFAGLPVWGEEGTLGRTPDFEQPGVIRAKTGALSNVAAISGMMRGASGEMYLFTWVVNNFPLRGKLDRFTYRNRMLKELWSEL